MNRLQTTLGFVAVVAAMLPQSSFAQTETQSFDNAASAEAAGWLANEEGQNPERECVDGVCETDLGWKPSNFADGAAAGEGGGLLHRSGDLPIGFYADTTIGILNLDMPFFARGKVALTNINFDGHAHLGFFDANRLLADPLDYGAMMGFQIAEPGGAVAPNFRWGYIFVDDQGSLENTNAIFTDGLPDSEALDFEIGYNPDEGDGLLTLLIGEEDPAELALTPEQRQNGATFTGFGVFTGPYAGSPRAQSMEIFIDDVTYTSVNTPSLTGDFNGNGEIDLEDIDILTAQSASGANLPQYDLTGDGAVNQADVTEWAKSKEIGYTWIGDANFDGQFDTGDLVQVLGVGKYEQPGARAVWSEGDWNGDGVFGTGDLVAALSDGGYEIGPRTDVSAVPEPSAIVLSLLGLAGLVGRSRCRQD